MRFLRNLIPLAVLCLAAPAFAAAVPTDAYSVPAAGKDFVYDGTATDAQDLTAMLRALRQAALYGQYQGLRTLTAIPAAPSVGYIHFFLSGVGLCIEDSSGNVYAGGSTSTPVTTYPDAGYVSSAAGDRYILGLLGVDGGIISNGAIVGKATNVTDITAFSLTASGALALDGGAVINNTLKASDSTLASVTASGAVGADGGLNANGGKAVPVVQDSTASTFILHNHGAIGTPVTFSTSFSATPECTCQDITAIAAMKCLTSGGPPVTTLTGTGTGTDAFSWICVGPR